AARAFTGWEIEGTEPVFRKNQHDDGEKTVLGQKGKFEPDDVVRICLEQKSAPRFIAGKLYRFLVSDEALPKELLDPLARKYRESNYDTGALVKTILSSNLFFSEEAYRSKVKSPVDFSLQIVKGLEGKIGATALAAAL